ncbi:facilitated trehalose transporter Tret1-like [Anabrus simplex]|uniref:facilitated trehalose transporter Tret1-like n=1 Tax=Anabrus simplex TaxID=316456 RepID=UPI0035A2EE61
MEKISSSKGSIYGVTTEAVQHSVLRQYMAAGAANLAAMVVGTVLGWSSPVLPKMSEDGFYLYASSEQQSWVGSLVALGAAIGPFPAGVLADRIGRKRTMLALTVPFLLGWIIITAAQSVGVIYFARILLGFAVGAVFTVCPMYVGEIAESNVRGALGSLMQLFVTFGFLYVYCIGPYSSYTALGMACTVLPIVFFCVMYVVPASPYYLVAQGRTEEAATALQWLRQTPAQEVREELEDIQESVREAQQNAGTLRDLVRTRGNVKALCLSLGLVSFQQLSGINAVLFYSEAIFLSTGSSMSASVSTIIVGVVMLLASCATPLLADRLGRKMLLYISAIGMAGSLAMLGLFFSGLEAIASITWLPVLCLVFYIIVYCVGFGPLPWAVMGELFPANVKSKASSCTASFCWLLGFFITKFFATIVEGLGQHTAFFLFAIFCGIAFVFVYVLLPETKGKSLQEIQDILNGGRSTQYSAPGEEL